MSADRGGMPVVVARRSRAALTLSADLGEVGGGVDIEPGPQFRLVGAAEQTHDGALDAPDTFKGCLGAAGDGRSTHRRSPPRRRPAGRARRPGTPGHPSGPAPRRGGTGLAPAASRTRRAAARRRQQRRGSRGVALVAVPAGNQPLRQDGAVGRRSVEHVRPDEQAGDTDGEQQQAEQGEADAVATVHLGHPFQAPDTDADLTAVGADKLVEHTGCALLDGGLGGAGHVGVQAHP